MNNVAWHKDQGVGFLHEVILRPNHSVVAKNSIFSNHSREYVMIFVAYIDPLEWNIREHVGVGLSSDAT